MSDTSGEIPTGRYLDPDTGSRFWYFPAVLQSDVNLDPDVGPIKLEPRPRNAGLMLDVDIAADPSIGYREYNLRNISRLIGNPTSPVRIEILHRKFDGSPVAVQQGVDDGYCGTVRDSIVDDADSAYHALQNLAEMVTDKTLDEWQIIQ